MPWLLLSSHTPTLSSPCPKLNTAVTTCYLSLPGCELTVSCVWYRLGGGVSSAPGIQELAKATHL